MEMDKGKMLMPFDDDSKSYANGFACGQIWERLNHADKIEGQYIRCEIIPQVEKMCRRFHYSFTISEAYEDWAILDAELSFENAN